MKLVNNLKRSSYVECHWAQAWVHVDLTLLRNLILGDHIEVREGLVHERRHIGSLLQNLCIGIVVDELQQLVKNFLYVSDLLKVRRH